MNYKDLTKIANHELVKGLPKLSRPLNQMCGPCQIGKQTKSVHKKVTHLATFRPLELIHMDLMGPTRTQSINGKRYIFLAVDDFTRFTWVNFLKEKSNTFEVFKTLVNLVQNEKQ